MKTILYIIIALFISGAFISAFVNKQNNKTTIVLKSENQNIDSISLKSSAHIISNRLSDFGCDSFIVDINEKWNVIKVTLKNNSNISTIKRLITQKGDVGFYETINRRKFISSVYDSRYILSIFNGLAKTNDVIGCTSKWKVRRVNKFLTKFGLDKYYKFAWFINSENSVCSLYALNDAEHGNGVMYASDIEDVLVQTMNKGMSTIHINFKKEASKKWENVTWHNFNNPIAVLIDGQVFTPVTKTVYKAGNCKLTGELSEKDMMYFMAITNNGMLSNSFKVIW
ncbi:MAG: hypothetical protein JEZ09_20990 [Salinivirgaceae bacterium]|nr:hypothetical protein [Salinivirgaceae bacterium]